MPLLQMSDSESVTCHSSAATKLQAGRITTSRQRGNREWGWSQKEKRQALSSWSHSDPSRGISSALTNPTSRHFEFLSGLEYKETGTGVYRCRECISFWQVKAKGQTVTGESVRGDSYKGTTNVGPTCREGCRSLCPDLVSVSPSSVRFPVVTWPF